MNKIIIFSGTTEGRRISEALTRAKQEHMVCVATESGEEVMEASTYASIHKGRLSTEEMVLLFQEEGAQVIVDATHPYAVEVTANIKAAVVEAGVAYERVLRTNEIGKTDLGNSMKITYFENAKECAKALANTTGNILLTTGSKELSVFCQEEGVRERIFARVLPAEESINLCKEAALDQRHIIAMFGPFTEEMNTAMLRQINAKILVTKESGSTGGYEEKLRAAAAVGAEVFAIGRPSKEEGSSVEAMISKLAPELTIFSIQLIGIGMGNEDTLTVGAKRAIEEADVILGASRMIQPYVDMYGTKKEIKDIYLSRDVIPFVSAKYSETKNCKIVLLFSGDSGMYSGTKKVLEALQSWTEGKTEVQVKVLPGISSISYFAARIGEPYSDAAIESWHGKANDEGFPGILASRIRRYERTYVLLSSSEDVKRLGHLLESYGLTESELVVGRNMSYEDEAVYYCSVSECKSLDLEEGLCLAMIKNPSPICLLGQAMDDSAFIREKVPMTKSEIRHLSVAKLQLFEGAVVYDIGAGTGSVSLEVAKQHESIRVFAIEKKPEAVELIKKNARALSCGNVSVVEAFAPEGFEGLPLPSHAFIGGSSGNMDQIIERLLNLNPDIRIVMNAITIETVAQMSELLKKHGKESAELVQVSVAKNKQAGNYTLMEGQNPVYIASFGGK